MKMEMGGDTNSTMMASPTNSSDDNETVEVGVIVMGLCCICVVACALVILQLRSNNRRIMGNRRRSRNAGGRSGDRTRDPLDIEAPPSYDAVIRSPHLYPPSRRTSVTLDVLETRRSSGSSNFSLSTHSPRIIPRGASEDNLPQHPDIQLSRGYREEGNDEPPPPYPGNVILIASRNARSMDYICSTPSRSADESTRTDDSERAGEIVPSVSNGRSPEGHTAGPRGSHVVTAWTDNEAENGASHGESNEACTCRTCDSCQPNTQGGNSVLDQRNSDVSRTFVSNSLGGAEEVVSPTHTSENVQQIAIETL